MSRRDLPHQWAWPLVVGALVLTLSSCGDRQQEAKQELSAKSFVFTVEEFMRAAREGNVSALRHFTDAGMEVDVKDAEGTTALFRAAQAGHAEAVQFLLGNGAKTDVVGTGYDTPLVAAARAGSLETVKALLDGKADPTVRTDKNWTALTAAAFRGELDCVKLLAPLSRESLDEALQIAALQGKTGVVDALLASGADVFSRSKDNKTPLMYAAANGHTDVVRLLLLNGANRLALDGEDQTADDLARAGGHDAVHAVLIDPKLPRKPAVAATGVTPAASAVAAGSATSAAPGSDPAVVAANDVDPVPSGEVIGEADNRPAEGGAPFNSDGEVAPDRRPSAAPPARLNGSSLAGLGDGSTGTVREQVRMKDFRESQLPILLEDVPAPGQSARIRVLGLDRRRSEIIPAGGPIGETGLELVKVERKFMPSKMGEGHLLDVSEAIVRDRATGQRHLVVKDVAAQSSQATALITAGSDGQEYEVREGDEFTAGGTSPVRYRVLDVRPTQVVIENRDTKETLTLARAYAR